MDSSIILEAGCKGRTAWRAGRNLGRHISTTGKLGEPTEQRPEQWQGLAPGATPLASWPRAGSAEVERSCALLEPLLIDALDNAAVPVAAALIETFGSLAAVLSADSWQLAKVPGMTEAAGRLLEAAHAARYGRHRSNPRAGPARRPACRETYLRLTLRCRPSRGGARPASGCPQSADSRSAAQPGHRSTIRRFTRARWCGSADPAQRERADPRAQSSERRSHAVCRRHRQQPAGRPSSGRRQRGAARPSRSSATTGSRACERWACSGDCRPASASARADAACTSHQARDRHAQPRGLLRRGRPISDPRRHVRAAG